MLLVHLVQRLPTNSFTGSMIFFEVSRPCMRLMNACSFGWRFLRLTPRGGCCEDRGDRDVGNRQRIADEVTVAELQSR
jgi:hypothetical protein